MARGLGERAQTAIFLWIKPPGECHTAKLASRLGWIRQSHCTLTYHPLFHLSQAAEAGKARPGNHERDSESLCRHQLTDKVSAPVDSYAHSYCKPLLRVGESSSASDRWGCC